MSTLQEYIKAASGFDVSGHPASITQITFGTIPFMVSDEEKVEDFTKINFVLQTDSVIDIKVVDNILQLEMDFANNVKELGEFLDAFDEYKEQSEHVREVVNDLTLKYDNAVNDEDQALVDELMYQLRSVSVPFMLPTIVPNEFAETIHLGFISDPKFVFFSSNKMNEMPSKVVMIFDAEDFYAEDNESEEVFDYDAEEQIRMEQEEMFWADEARRIEEEEYRAMYGNSVDYYEDDGNENNLTNLSGIRFK